MGPIILAMITVGRHLGQPKPLSHPSLPAAFLTNDTVISVFWICTFAIKMNRRLGEFHLRRNCGCGMQFETFKVGMTGILAA